MGVTLPSDLADVDDVHTFFSLTYANYLVLPRTLLQSMPAEWQARFVGCLRELDDAFAHVPQASGYWVRAQGDGGRFVKDPVPHYNRGRTYVEPQISADASVPLVASTEGGKTGSGRSLVAPAPAPVSTPLQGG